MVRPTFFAKRLWEPGEVLVNMMGKKGCQHMGANQSNVSVEMIEQDYPIRINQYGLVPDTGGAGQYRGGLALMREYESLHDGALLNVRSDKEIFHRMGFSMERMVNLQKTF